MTKNDGDSITLHYTNDSHRGPGKVVQNLKKGLKELNLSVLDQYDSKDTKYIGCLQASNLQYLKACNKSILLGPNLFVLPSDNPELCKVSNHFVVPSQWVKNLYERFEEMKNKSIYVWSVGIDTEKWKPVDKEKNLDCFIYFKNRSENDLALVEAVCRKFRLKYEVIKYGYYQEQELKNLCDKSKFCILLTGTESQGIAYMQILSTNTPCYVFNCPTWKSEDKKHQIKASSVPYFDERCGEVSNNVNLAHFQDFLKKCEQKLFAPRKYILENHTLKKSAKKYFNFLKTTYNEVQQTK